jgi:hypothetical protein
LNGFDDGPIGAGTLFAFPQSVVMGVCAHDYRSYRLTIGISFHRAKTP